MDNTSSLFRNEHTFFKLQLNDFHRHIFIDIINNGYIL